MSKNPYEVLGVSKTASQQEIKKAYRKSALENHPDKGGDAEKFKEINKANDILSDPEKRKRFDQFGDEDDNPRGHGFQGFSGGFPGFPSGFPGFHRGRQGPKKCEDIQHIMKITLKEVYNGSTRKLKIHRKLICPLCEGFGTKDKTESKCNCNDGKKTIVRHVGPGMIQQMVIACNECKGTGHRVTNSDNKCEICNGNRTVNDQNIVTVTIQKGVTNGKIMKFPGQANQQRDYESGDLLIKLQIEPSQTIFDFRGHNLLLNKSITLAEALSGFSFIVQQLDERKLHVQSKHIIRPDQTLMIKGEGLPILNSSSNGDLIIQFHIQFPEKVIHKEVLPKIFSQTVQNEEMKDEYESAELLPISAEDKQRHKIVNDSEDEDEEHQNGMECRQQ